MKNDYTNNKFKELLDNLQQDSWQLELLISGFAIFGLFSSIEPLNTALNEAEAIESYAKHFYRVGLISCYVLIVNLVISPAFIPSSTSEGFLSVFKNVGNTNPIFPLS